MKKLILNVEETKELEKFGSVEIIRNGFDILVEFNEYEEDFNIVIINPYDRVCLSKK